MIIRMEEGPFTFYATHVIPSFPAGDRDRTPHGHDYAFTVEVKTHIDPALGYTCDHKCIVQAGMDVGHLLHEKHINDVPSLERGLTEDVLAYLVSRLQERLDSSLMYVSRVTLYQRGQSTHVKTWLLSDNE